MKFMVKQFMKFTTTSGLGWILDFLIYSLLVHFFSSFISNCISATVAVTFVYLLSVNKIFNVNTNYAKLGFVMYLIYQSFSIICFSILINFLSSFELFSIFGGFKYQSIKILVTPFTLFTNFVFMKILANYMSKKGEKNGEATSFYSNV